MAWVCWANGRSRQKFPCPVSQRTCAGGDVSGCCHSSGLAALGGHLSYVLSQRLAAAERDSLCAAIQAMRQTGGLWRMVEKNYPIYQRLLVVQNTFCAWKTSPCSPQGHGPAHPDNGSNK